MTEKTKNEIIQDAIEDIEKACINIKDNLQRYEIKLIDADILSLADTFFDILKSQNSKVIVTGDGK